MGRLGSDYQAVLEEIETPRPGPGEVVVTVHAAPVNYVDLLTMRGAYQVRPQVPYTPGKGPAGVIEAVGLAVEGLAVGDRVLAMAEYGGYAETVVADSAQVYRLPDELGFPEAAAMAVSFDTAWVALRERGRLGPGESVLVLGANGAVGSAALQLARAMGASIVLAGVSSPGRYAGAQALGADGMVDLSRPDLRQSLRDQVWALTEGRGVDVVIDPLGGDPFDGAVRAVAWSGRLVVVGFAAGRIPTLAMNYPLLKNIEVSGLQISDYRLRRPDLLEQCYRELFAWIGEGKITPPQTRSFRLTDWEAALESLQAGTVQGRIVLIPERS